MEAKTDSLVSDSQENKGKISGVSSIAQINNPGTPVTSHLYIPDRNDTPTTTKGKMRYGVNEEARYSEMSIANTIQSDGGYTSPGFPESSKILDSKVQSPNVFSKLKNQ